MSLFKNYALIDQIGEGGMGRVFLAYRKAAHAVEGPFALKVLNAKHQTAERKKDFEFEANLASRLQHPSIVRFEEFIENETGCAIVMEYLSGESLSNVFKRSVKNNGLPLSVVMTVATRIAEGLHYLHDFNSKTGSISEVIHGDLSPQNIIITDTGSVKLIDFGISRPNRENDSLSMTMALANPWYASPNRLRRNFIAISDDIFSFGLLLWEMLTDRRYHVASSRSEVIKALENFSPRDPRDVNPDIPEDIAKFVVSCLDAETLNGVTHSEELVQRMNELKEIYAPGADEADIQDVMHTLFANEVEKRKSSRGSKKELAVKEFVDASSTRGDTTAVVAAVAAVAAARPETPVKVAPPKVSPERVQSKVGEEFFRAPKGQAINGIERFPRVTKARRIFWPIFLILSIGTFVMLRHYKTESEKVFQMIETEVHRKPESKVVDKILNVAIVTIPAGGEVLIDGASVGRAPLNVKHTGKPLLVDVGGGGFNNVSLILDNNSKSVTIDLKSGEYQVQ